MKKRVLVVLAAFFILGIISNLYTALVVGDTYRSSLRKFGNTKSDIEGIIVIPYLIKSVIKSKTGDHVALFYQSWDIAFFGIQIWNIWEKNGRD